MKKFSNFFMMALLGASLFACSSEDDPMNEPEIQHVDNIYMSLDIKLPQVSRSRVVQGEEIGQGVENKINNIKVILVDPIGDKTVSSTSPKIYPGTTPTEYTVGFDAKDILTLADAKGIKVYVVCNNQSIVDAGFKTNLSDAFLLPSADDKTFWGGENFLMANANQKYNTVNIPSVAELKSHNTVNNAFNLSEGMKPIEVERAAVRLDFAQTNIAGTTTPNTYPMKKEAVDNPKGEETGVSIKLTHMSLTNVSKNFYTFRHVATPVNKGYLDSEALGDENGNYVVDTDAEAKFNYLQKEPVSFTLSGNYYNPWGDFKKSIQETSTDDTFTDIASWYSNATNDNHDSWNPTEEQQGYKIWKYTSENTIPQANFVAKGVPSCVVFRGEIAIDKAKATPEMQAAFEKSNYLYVYDNVLYGDWAMFKAKATANAAAGNHTLQNIVNLVQPTDPKAEPDFQKAFDQGLKMYKKVKDSFPVYYYYWIKHNDVYPSITDQPDVTKRIMEYGLVRNNVYKMKVSTILNYGDPIESIPEPWTPIDDSKLYLKMQVSVLPWTVRINNIEF